MTKLDEKDVLLIELMNKHPEMKERIEALLIMAEANEVKTADEIEGQLIEEIKKLGQQTLHSWAASQEQQQADRYTNDRDFKKHGKKSPLEHNVWNNNSC